ncbi:MULTISPECIES: PilX N-terminal domain-containing pilus assembly protein [Halomonadaceae]|uniref:pilus assembly PilX family protein n=1 Tax=Halomonadaceae TaxID=28256 RepID=UPI001597617F|nr:MULTISPECIES: PilX N-terminal domain-containing pilus assembly protein [Halomonas]QJQ94282.1 hypothetical protein HIO72_02600 [Halomonas sp. PA5]
MALIIAMVFMLLLTMLGLSAMQNTTLQERMAGNQRDHGMAFQAAEAGLREAERLIEIGIIEPEEGESLQGKYAFSSVANLSRDPEYTIESTGVAGYYNADGCERIYHAYLITSIGYGGSANSQVELESRYIRSSNDDCE